MHVLECERGHLCVRARCVKTACGSTGRRGRGQRGVGRRLATTHGVAISWRGGSGAVCARAGAWGGSLGAQRSGRCRGGRRGPGRECLHVARRARRGVPRRLGSGGVAGCEFEFTRGFVCVLIYMRVLYGAGRRRRRPGEANMASAAPTKCDLVPSCPHF